MSDKDQKTSKLEKLSEYPSFQRGQSDAQRGFPPREGSQEYNEGYSVGYEQKLRQERTQNTFPVLTRDQIMPMPDADIDSFYWRSDDGEGFIPK